MPQYDAYEDPLPLVSPLYSMAEQTVPLSPLTKFPINKPLTTCHDEGINKPSDTDTPEIDKASPPPSPHHFQRRHSLLSQQQVPTVEAPTFPEPGTSPRRSPQVEKEHLAIIERSQQPDNSIRMDLQSDQQTAEQKHREQEWKAKDAEIEFDEEKHTIKGGWMHRSRGSAELLRDRKSWNIGGD